LHACPCLPVFSIGRAFQNAGDQPLNFHQQQVPGFIPVTSTRPSSDRSIIRIQPFFLFEHR
jgi:hypothetical protein